MIDVIPIVVFVVIGATWVATGIQNHRLLKAFVARFPAEAAGTRLVAEGQDPEKALFFLRASTVPLLRRDERVWKMRQQFVVWIAASAAIPVLVLAIEFAAALLLVPR